MGNSMIKTFSKILSFISMFRSTRRRKNRLKQLQERDPFIYK